MRRLLLYILLLLCSPSLLAQSGVGYVNYKSYKTHYGNGNSSTRNGVTYSGISDNITELEAVLDVNQPGTTLTHQGEVQVNTSQGFIGGKPPHWYSEYYAVHHWGWLQAKETGTYRFKLTSDDASALWVDEQLVLFRPCCGTSYVNVSMVAGQWYRIDTKWQEYTGGDNMSLLYSPPSSASYFNVGVNNTHLIFTNIEPTSQHTLDVTYNINSALDKTKFSSWIDYPDLGTQSNPLTLTSQGTVGYDETNGLQNTTLNVTLGLDETYFTTTYPDLITIADVVKGFSQLTNQTDTPEGLGGGIFTSDVEFILGDVNNDDSFDFKDTQLLLDHIMGEVSPFDNYLIADFIKTFESNYTNSVTVDWELKKEDVHTHILDDSNLEQTREFNVAFLGDLNFSHSAPLQQIEVSAKASPQLMFSKNVINNLMSLDVVRENDIFKVTLEIPQNQNNITGTQFKVNYDESRLEFQDSNYSSVISSFTSKRSGYINIGSFSADGSLNLNDGITYTLNFKLKSNLDSTLGLISLAFSELVDKDGNKVDYTVR